MTSKQVMIFAVDDSDHSFYALDWILNHFFTPASSTNFKLIIIHARVPPTSLVGLVGPGSNEFLPVVEADAKRSAEKVIAKAKEACTKKSVVDAQYEVMEGDARSILCDAADKYHASLLVLGSHGYGAFKRAVLGSVSDYCSHHAHCSVMIVKKPKTKN